MHFTPMVSVKIGFSSKAAREHQSVSDRGETALIRMGRSAFAPSESTWGLFS